MFDLAKGSDWPTHVGQLAKYLATGTKELYKLQVRKVLNISYNKNSA